MNKNIKKLFTSASIGVASSLFAMPVICLAITSCSCSSNEKITSLCFTSQKDNSTIGWTYVGTKPAGLDIEYSLDNQDDWQEWDGSNITLNNGQKIFVKNNGNSLSTSMTNYFNFIIDGDSKISASGSIMSMINDAQLSEYCFYNIFQDCTGLLTAPELLATTLVDYCYASMFYRCSGLTTPPKLPATTMADYCYYAMFNESGILYAPELPAMTLAEGCYSQMFGGCTSLINAPILPATSLFSLCYFNMFAGCSSLTTAPELPAMTLVEKCYWWMFDECTSLTTPPKLPATTLADYCYSYMFHGCTLLTTAPELPATTLAPCCYGHMFFGCISLKVKENDATSATKIFTCPNTIPTDAVIEMFNSTAGTFMDTPTSNQTYYWYL